MSSLQLSFLMPQADWAPPAELPSLRGCQRVAIDVETCDPHLHELGPGVRRGAYVVGLAVGTDDGCRAYLPVRHEGGGNLPPALVWGWARDELNAFDGELVGANLKYDLDFLAEAGVTFPRVKRFRDVQLAEPLLDEHRYSYGLGALAKDYLGREKNERLLWEAAAAYGLKKPTEQAVKQLLWRMPANLVGAYAEDDVDLPLSILPLQERKLEAEELSELFDLECRLIPMVLAMTRRGVRINLERLATVRAELSRLRDARLAEVRRLAGPKAELSAPATLAPALEARGLVVPRTAKTGQPSITKAFFEKNAGDELVRAVAGGRRLQTLITTFLDGLERHAVAGRVHCTINQLKGDDGGTIARFATQDPSLQNIPKRRSEFDDGLGLSASVVQLIRGVFEPEPGEDWSLNDYSQIEYRLLAHYAVGRGAAECRQKYNEDPKTDYHKLCAEFMHVDPEDKVRRGRVKNVNFAKGYGARAAKLAIVMNCTEAEAVAFIREYENALPFTVDSFEKASRVAATRGYIVTALKRRMRFPLWEPANSYGADRRPALPREKAEAAYGLPLQRASTYVALNRLLQGSAADLMKKAMVDIWEAGVCDVLGAPLITVHDELDLSVPRRPEAVAALAELKRLMENAVPLRVPVRVESETGANWGDCA